METGYIEHGHPRQNMQVGDQGMFAKTGIEGGTAGGIDGADEAIDGEDSSNDHGNTDGGEDEHRDSQEAGEPMDDYCTIHAAKLPKTGRLCRRMRLPAEMCG
jgi:hypothetical protein